MSHDGFEIDFRQGSAPGEPDQRLPDMGPGGIGFDIGKAGPSRCEQAPGGRKPTAEEGGGRASTTWTPNTCASMLMGKIVLIGELLPDGTNRSPLSGLFEGGTIDGPLPPGLAVGFSYPVSLHLVRAKEHLRINAMQRLAPGEGEIEPAFGDEAPPHLEACTFHIGRWAVRGDGFRHVMHCSQPQPGTTSVRIGFGEPFIHRAGLFADPDMARLTEDWAGFKMFAAAYMTPFIQEASLRSFVPTCGIPI